MSNCVNAIWVVKNDSHRCAEMRRILEDRGGEVVETSNFDYSVIEGQFSIRDIALELLGINGNVFTAVNDEFSDIIIEPFIGEFYQS
jgi:hypothetical protein